MGGGSGIKRKDSCPKEPPMTRLNLLLDRTVNRFSKKIRSRRLFVLAIVPHLAPTLFSDSLVTDFFVVRQILLCRAQKKGFLLVLLTNLLRAIESNKYKSKRIHLAHRENGKINYISSAIAKTKNRSFKPIALFGSVYIKRERGYVMMKFFSFSYVHT